MPLSDARRRLIGRLRRRATREREGAVLVEGVRGATEAMEHASDVRSVVCSPRLRNTEGGRRLADAVEAVGIDAVWITDTELAGVSDTEASQGVLLIAAQPRPEPGTVLAGGARVVLIDGVQDPGNVGTLIRSAAALGSTGVVALDGTADPWSAKAVRASAGTAFRIPVILERWEEIRSRIQRAELPVLVADADGRDVSTTRLGPGWVLALGSEAHGVRADVRDLAAARVAVPMPGGTESLNVGVAGAILLYALWRDTPHA